MNYIRNIWYNLLAIKNNIILNILLVGNIFYPTYFNNKIVKYKNIGDNYYKYIFLLNFNDKIIKIVTNTLRSKHSLPSNYPDFFFL